MRAGWRFWRYKIHWQILLAIALGVGAGAALQLLDARPQLDFRIDEVGRVEKIGTDARRAGIQVGDRLVVVGEGEVERAPSGAGSVDVPWAAVGDRVRVIIERDGLPQESKLPASMSADSPRAQALAPFDFIGQLFQRLLQMLIVPLVFTSLVTGVLSLGDLGSLGRLGARAVLYYMVTSVLAIGVGLLFVNMIAPGRGAQLDLRAELSAEDFATDESFLGIFLRMIPTNPVGAFADNGSILQVIFFALLVGIFITRTGGEHADLLRRFFDAAYAVMMRLAQAVLVLIPIGVFALIVRVAGASGLAQFQPLLLFMATVVGALLVHALVVLPAFLYIVGRVRPWRWARAVSPALMTAFSTSSSSIT
ncbi:MAG TPA: dicarboxylate/amino acid:cation symporter, partial [Planctomycetota bacterium]|nr:dicarboxylate/amino acid:cation symporter [Planctomycetota bacterium]